MILKVKDLIDELSKMDPTLPIVSGGEGGWYYYIKKVEEGHCSEGREIDPDPFYACVLIRTLA